MSAAIWVTGKSTFSSSSIRWRSFHVMDLAFFLISTNPLSFLFFCKIKSAKDFVLNAFLFLLYLECARILSFRVHYKTYPLPFPAMPFLICLVHDYNIPHLITANNNKILPRTAKKCLFLPRTAKLLTLTIEYDIFNYFIIFNVFFPNLFTYS
mgnify:CR=1 FL=1